MKQLTYLSLIRPRHTGQVVGIIAILSVKNMGFSVQSLLAITSFLCLCIALFSFDDAQDYISDSLVHPERLIPSGLMTRKQVYLIGGICLCLSLVCAVGLRGYQFILFVFTAVLGFFVIFLKLHPILRAFFIGAMIFLLFPFGMSINVKSLVFGLIVALPHIAGTISKDFLHVPGDGNIGLQRPPEWARYLASSLFFVSGMIVLLPLVLNQVTLSYLPLILPTLACCFILGGKVLNAKFQKVYVYGGIGMLSTLVAFALNI